MPFCLRLDEGEGGAKLSVKKLKAVGKNISFFKRLFELSPPCLGFHDDKSVAQGLAGTVLHHLHSTW